MKHTLPMSTTAVGCLALCDFQRSVAPTVPLVSSSRLYVRVYMKYNPKDTRPKYTPQMKPSKTHYSQLRYTILVSSITAAKTSSFSMLLIKNRAQEQDAPFKLLSVLKCFTSTEKSRHTLATFHSF